jgi:hypothetical protein
MGNTNDCFSCFDYPSLIIAVKTGDTKGVGLHNCAFVTLIDEKGKSSQEFSLLGSCFTVFKRGHTDVFTFQAKLDIGPIAKLKLSRSELNERRCVEWFVEKIELRRYFEGLPNSFDKKEDLVFPCHRWIRNKRPIVLENYDSSLPQYDTESEQRELEIFWKRHMFRYHRISEGLPPQVTTHFTQHFCTIISLFSWNTWNIKIFRLIYVS